MADELKICSKCKRPLPRDREHFHADAKKKDGFQPLCKECKGIPFGSHKTHPLQEGGLRRCTRNEQCAHPDGPWLPATTEYFRPNKRYTGGLSTWCVACDSAYHKTDPARKAQRKRRETDGYKTRMHNYRSTEDYKVRVRSTKKTPEYKAKDHEGKRQRNKKYLSTEKGKAQRVATKQRRRARMSNLPNDFTPAEWQRGLDYFEGKCAVCGSQPDFWTTLAADHWIPLSKGGSSTKMNLVPLCHGKKGRPFGEPSCNNSKGNHDPLEWLESRFGTRRAREIIKRIETYFQWVREQDGGK